MNIQDVLEETGKVRGTNWETTYARLKGGVLTQYVIKDDDDIGAVDLNCILDTDWVPYHEEKEIRPKKVGELWKHESGLHAHTFRDKKGNLCINEDQCFFGTDTRKATQVIHNKNGWTRLHPLVEDENVERIEIEESELRSFSTGTSTGDILCSLAVPKDAYDKLVKVLFDKPMKMILEIPKEK